MQRIPNTLLAIFLTTLLVSPAKAARRSHDSHHEDQHHEHWDGHRETEARPLFTPSETDGTSLMAPYGGVKATKEPSTLQYHNGHVDVRYTSGKIKIDREIKRHEDYADKALAAFQNLSAKANNLSVYWDKRLQAMGGYLDTLSRRPDDHYGHYSHAMTHWQDNAYKAEDYATRAQDLRNRMSRNALQIQQNHMPNIRQARHLMATSSKNNQINEMQMALELSRQSYEAIVGLVNQSRDLEIQLNELEFTTKADKEAASSPKQKSR